jgi:metal-sulfur cluster biosynthetic enzyme
MNPSAPKENVNPTIRSVEKERLHARRTPFEWSQIGTFTKANDADDAGWLPNSAEDSAILKALLDISKHTHGKGVTLLENAGLTLPTVPIDAMKTYPSIHLEDEPKSKLQGEPTNAVSNIERDSIDAEEVFDIIRNIQDPEHPNTLEQLAVVSLEQVEVMDVDSQSTANIRFTPTIPHCSMATLIGLCLTVKLMRSLPSRFKISVQIEPGTHASERAINKQLRDKERVCAALENKHLAGVVNKCIKQGADAHGR